MAKLFLHFKSKCWEYFKNPLQWELCYDQSHARWVEMTCVVTRMSVTQPWHLCFAFLSFATSTVHLQFPPRAKTPICLFHEPYERHPHVLTHSQMPVLAGLQPCPGSRCLRTAQTWAQNIRLIALTKTGESRATDTWWLWLVFTQGFSRARENKIQIQEEERKERKKEFQHKRYKRWDFKPSEELNRKA